MDGARDFKDKESLGHPRNQVYAIIDDAENARRAAKEQIVSGLSRRTSGFLSEKRTLQNWTLQPVSTVF
jgi:hypothetical protein